MTWAPNYIEDSDLQSYLRIPSEDTTDDAEIALAVTAASRAVDAFCGRQFGETGESEERTYEAWYHRPSCRYRVEIDDLADVTAVTVTVGSVEYDETEVSFWPYNAAAAGSPYTTIILPEDASPADGDLIVVETTWGWEAVPEAVEQATLIQAARFFVRRNAPFGIAGSPDTGSEMRLLAKIDPDVAVILGQYRRHWVVR